MLYRTTDKHRRTTKACRNLNEENDVKIRLCLPYRQRPLTEFQFLSLNERKRRNRKLCFLDKSTKSHVNDYDEIRGSTNERSISRKKRRTKRSKGRDLFPLSRLLALH